MSVRVGINGFGRIGRNFYRAFVAAGADIEVVGINDLTDTKTLAHLTKYDSTLGRFPGTVTADDAGIVIDGRRIPISKQTDPAALPWGDLGAEIIIESTGHFTDATKAAGHLTAGAKKVIISAPAKNEDVTVVMGVNDTDYDPASHNVISNASCTTNCLAPMAKVLHDTLRHRARPDDDHSRLHQRPEDPRLPTQRPAARSCGGINMIPTSTGAAKAIGLVLPELKGKLDGYSMRVPIPTGSATDLTAQLSREVTRDEVNAALKAAAEGPLAGYLSYTEDPIVSTDIVTDPSSCIIDSQLTNASGSLVKVVGWYDNEWGYSNRLVDLVGYVGESL